MLFLALVAARAQRWRRMAVGRLRLAAVAGRHDAQAAQPAPWAWPRHGWAMPRLVAHHADVCAGSTVAAQADWSAPVAGVVLALIAVRLLAKALGVALGNGQRRQLEASRLWWAAR